MVRVGYFLDGAIRHTLVIKMKAPKCGNRLIQYAFHFFLMKYFERQQEVASLKAGNNTHLKGT